MSQIVAKFGDLVTKFPNFNKNKNWKSPNHLEKVFYFYAVPVHVMKLARIKSNNHKYRITPYLAKDKVETFCFRLAI